MNLVYQFDDNNKYVSEILEVFAPRDEDGNMINCCCVKPDIPVYTACPPTWDAINEVWIQADQALIDDYLASVSLPVQDSDDVTLMRLIFALMDENAIIKAEIETLKGGV